jgi:ribonuclease P protein component
MLKSENRLRKRKEFAYLYNNGTAKHTEHLTVVYLPTKYRALKIGFSVAKKIGKAHIRNLVKRRLRSIVRELVGQLPDNYNMVVIAKSGIENVPFDALVKETNLLFSKTGLIKNV